MDIFLRMVFLLVNYYELSFVAIVHGCLFECTEAKLNAVLTFILSPFFDLLCSKATVSGNI